MPFDLTDQHGYPRPRGSALAAYAEQAEPHGGTVRRVDRLRRTSKLPAGKTWETFEHDRAPVQLRQQLQRLGEGDFVDHGVNVLAFGMPDTGKTYAMCAIGHRLVESSHSVLFTLIAERYERRSLSDLKPRLQRVGEGVRKTRWRPRQP